jgi:hypothetical protein
LKSFKTLNFCHFEQKKNICQNRTLFYLLSFSKKELAGLGNMGPMTNNFQKIKGLVFTHNRKSQKIKRIDQRTLAPKAFVLLPVLP